MRKALFWIALLTSIMLSVPMKAQFLLDQTFYNPIPMPTVRQNSENVNLNLINGCTFQGKKVTTFENDIPKRVTYFGTLTTPSGDRYVSSETIFGFDANFNPREHIWYIPAGGGDVYSQKYQNGVCVSSSKEYRSYTLDGPYFRYNEVTTGGGYIATPNYTGGSNSGSSSGNSTYDYNRHESTCQGCHGNGLCQHCNGSGYVNNRKSKCSLCHGTGRCQSCAGLGKFHGNF